MDPELARLVREDTPQLNPKIARGFAIEEVNTAYYDPQQQRWLSGALCYVHRLLQAAAPSFPDGLEYLGCEVCFPEEELKYRTREDWRDKKRKFDTARADLQLCKFHFRYFGQKFTHYLYLPFVGVAASFHLRDTRYFIAPVLMDQLITKKADRIFVRMMKTRFNVRREPVQYMEGDQRQIVQLHYTRLFHNEDKDQKTTAKGLTSLAHYLFCKYGVAGTFLNFANTTPVIGGGEINYNVYPRSDWVICSSTGVPPSGVRQRGYVPSFLRIAIRRSEYTFLVRKLVGAFFYVADFYPQRLTVEYVENKLLWRILLGLFIFPSTRGEGFIQDTVNRHLEWLDEYVDFLTQMKIRQLGWPVNNTFELFAYILTNYDRWWLTDKAPGPSMYGKELAVLYFFLSNIVQGIHRLLFKLRKPRKRALNVEQVRQQFTRYLHPESIYGVRHSHSELLTFGTSGDNMAAKITSKIIPQERYIRPTYQNEEQTMRATNPFELLHASVAEIGQYLKLSRSSPDGRDNINPFVQVNGDRVVQRNPSFAPLLDEIQADIEASRNK